MSVEARAIKVSGPEAEAPARCSRPPLVAREKVFVGAEFRVRLGLRCHGEFGPGRQCARLEAAHDPRLDLGEFGERLGAHVPASFGVFGDRVRRLAAASHHAVHPHRRRQLLTQQSDRDLRDGERVGGVDAPVGVGGGVCRLAV